jgi:hypothetical protein
LHQVVGEGIVVIDQHDHARTIEDGGGNVRAGKRGPNAKPIADLCGKIFADSLPV